jgi:adenine deaminase
MINPGYIISAQETLELKQFKKSEAYSSYLKSIATSPAYISIMDEHINNIDIVEDVNKLKTEGILPSNTNSKNVSLLFKQTLCRMAIGILADAIILKELEDCKIEEVLADLKADSNVTYLLGKANKKYYDQAKKLLNKGELKEDTLAYRGLLAYTKLTENNLNEIETSSISIEKEEVPTIVFDNIPEVKVQSSSKIDFNSDDIQL